MGKTSGKKTKGKKAKSRRLSLKLGFFLLAFLGVWGGVSEWYVHHPRAWLNERYTSWPKLVTAPLYWMGNPLADLTDALGWTGHDAVYEYDESAPEGSVLFAGIPVRKALPAPDDIRVLERGEFMIGWSDKLRHPVWCAYHVRKDANFDVGTRPAFMVDRAVPSAPHPNDYTKSGYDRGHMVPNYAIITRYGDVERRKTFRMSNIAPQTPALNRGVWRHLEHRIADLWTARYGEIWVIVGSISNGREKIAGTGIDVPDEYYQLVIAQEGMDIRALAVLFPQRIPWNAWEARNLVTIDELEQRTGLDFNPDLPSFIQDPLESDLPSRLWPVRLRDILKLATLRFQ